MPSLSCCQGQRGSQRRTLTCNWAATVGQFTDSASWAALPLPSSQSWALVPSLCVSNRKEIHFWMILQFFQ